MINKNVENLRNVVTRDRYFFVKSDYKLVKVYLDDLMYIEGLKDYVRIYIKGQKKPVLSLLNMKAIEDALPVPEFMRIHRSYIANMSMVKTFDRAHVKINDITLPLSEKYKEDVLNYFRDHIIN